MNVQKRHWCATVWPKHIQIGDMDDEELIEEYKRHWRGMKSIPNLLYAVAQIERSPQTGKLHIQAYTEWKTSKRLSEVYKLCPGDLDYRKGTRDDARDYCRKKTWKGKDKGQVLKLPEIGEWRVAKSTGPSPKQRALDYLKKGFTPSMILEQDVDVYFTHYRAINETYDMMVKSGISISTLAKMDNHGEEE